MSENILKGDHTMSEKIVKKGVAGHADREEFLRSAIPVATALFLLMASVAYIVYRIVDNHNYNERWKDYDECGLS